MVQARRTILIERPPDQVFAFFTDPGNDRSWRRHVKEVAATGPLRPGSVVHQVVKGPAGRGIPADLEVTAYEPPSRYAFKVTAGPVRPVGEFLFRPVATGTEVTLSLRAELGGVKGLLMSRPVRSSMESEVASLDTAKSLIERG
jgi:uncharacterized protein YndB with AHSA1/START domain